MSTLRKIPMKARTKKGLFKKDTTKKDPLETLAQRINSKSSSVQNIKQNKGVRAGKFLITFSNFISKLIIHHCYCPSKLIFSILEPQ